MSEFTPTIPPYRHLIKAEDRLLRLREQAKEMHAAITPDNPTRFPRKRVRQEYLDTLDLVLRDYERILVGLLGERGLDE